jgi:hypothetical protein
MTFSTSARKTIDNENPSHVIDFGKVEVRLYDVSKKGTYGWQKLAVSFNYPDNKEYRTGGCGFCKTNAALEQIFDMNGIDLHGATSGNTTNILREYHLGGNYYKVPSDKFTIA